MRSILVLATANAGKAVEIRALLPKVQVETLADHPDIVMPPEDEPTFEGNAAGKAEHVAAILGVPVLADDSGLVVDALGGAPGVLSARYAEGSDAVRVEKLLHALDGVPAEQRTARFVCAVAFAVPGQKTKLVRGTCEGSIAASPRGANGFGYDPVFLVGGGPRTLAEFSMEEKNAVSHRGRAVRSIMPELLRHYALDGG